MTEGPPPRKARAKPTLNFFEIPGSTSSQIRAEDDGPKETSSGLALLDRARLRARPDSLYATVAGLGSGVHGGAVDALATRLDRVDLTGAGPRPPLLDPRPLDPRAQLDPSLDARAPAAPDPRRARFDIKPDTLTFLLELGAGNGGSVCKVAHSLSGVIMARKTIPVPETSEPERITLRARISRELKILNRCSSPYIVAFYGAYIVDEPKSVNVVMEFMDLGSLDDVYRKVGPFSDIMAGEVARSMLEGMAYLFDTFKIMHRDIKPSNVLVASNGTIKLADFGVSGEVNTLNVAGTFVGTGIYMSPERILGQPYTIRSDVWSLGLTVLEILCGVFPIPLPPSAPIFEQIQYIVNEFHPWDVIETHVPNTDPELKDFLHSCLQKTESARKGVKDLLNHTFLERIKSLNIDVKGWAEDIRDR